MRTNNAGVIVLQNGDDLKSADTITIKEFEPYLTYNRVKSHQTPAASVKRSCVQNSGAKFYAVWASECTLIAF